MAKKRDAKVAPVAPAAAPADNAAAIPAGAAVPPEGDAPRPKASFMPAYMFGGSMVVRMLLVPIIGLLATAGITSRFKYPPAYAADGVQCTVEALDGPTFCEHELVFPEGVAILSCDAGRAEWNTVMGPVIDPDPRGQLWLYDYAKTKKSTALELNGFPALDFHPLGMAHIDDTLFVINHGRFTPTIEVFELDRNFKLTYKRTIGPHEDIRAANALVAKSATELYVTNDHAYPILSTSALQSSLETFSGVVYPRTFVTHVDISGAEPVFTRAAGNIPFSNGIAKGTTDETYYVVSTTRGSVIVFKPVNETSPILQKVEELTFGFLLDNIDVVPRTSEHVDENGKTVTYTTDEIYVGGHAKLYGKDGLVAAKAGAHLDGPERKKAPSWLASARRYTATERRRLTDDKSLKGQLYPQPSGAIWHEPKHEPKSGWRKRTIYQNDGTEFRTATGMAVDVVRNLSVSGGLYEKGVLVCRGVMENLPKGASVMTEDAGVESKVDL